MELKLNDYYNSTFGKNDSNRTFMELKFLKNAIGTQEGADSNRTFMELNEVFLIKKRKTTIVSYFVFGQKSGIQVANTASNYTFLLPDSFNNAIRSGRCFS